MAYPPQQGGYPPQQGGYPPQAFGYPPAQGGGYPPAQGGGYPPAQGGGYPPAQGGGYPPQGPPVQQPAGAVFSPPCSKILLKISARDLAKLDTFSESDPVCVLYMSSPHTGGQRVEVGRTEHLKNQKNPDFAKGFEVDYYFEERQDLSFRLYDMDGTSHALDAHDFIGEVRTSIGEIVGSSCGNFVKPLQREAEGWEKTHGQLHVIAEELSDAKGDVELQLRGEGLDKKDFFGKSDPYLELLSMSAGGAYVVFHKTEVVMKTLNPTWRRFTIPVATFCNGDMDRPIQIKVHDWDSDGGHDLIGTAETTLNELMSSRTEWDLINPKKMPGGKKAKKGYKNSGVVHMMTGQIVEKPSFFDYIVGGLELSFTVGVDFTGSNGNPTLPTSLHYMNPHAPNQYVHAITAVGNIIQDYDTDKMFPAMGYGGKVNGNVSHCFALNGNEANPFCHGIQGIVGAYQQAIQAYQLWGPTNFAPLINHVAGIAQGSLASAQNGQVYFVLLIITDGAITDREDTITAIVAAANLPMSIIIIGVGNADFGTMEMLDGDGDALKNSRGEKAVRDIVQFVPFRLFHNNDQALAKEVLAELPNQVVEYQSKHGLRPHARGASVA